METVLLTLHIFGAGVMIGTVCMAVFTVIKPPVTATSLDRLQFVSRFGMVGSVWQLLTGLILYFREPDEIGAHGMFWVKVGLWLVMSVLSATLLRRQGMRAGKALAAGQVPARAGLLTLLLVNAIAVLMIAAIGVALVQS